MKRLKMKETPKGLNRFRIVLVAACVVAAGLFLYWATRTSKLSVEPASPSVAPPSADNTEATQAPRPVRQAMLSKH